MNGENLLTNSDTGAGLQKSILSAIKNASAISTLQVIKLIK